MKLYYGRGACSLAPHIVLHESGIKHEAIQVNMKTKEYGESGDYRKVNPKGSVPALEMNDGQILTENAVILQFLADQNGEGTLFPKQGTMERYRAQEWLNFIATEVHKNYSVLFNEKADEKMREAVKETLGRKFDFLSATLSKQDYILGSKVSVADVYLFVVLNWSGFLKVDLSKWPVLTKFIDRMMARPAVQGALKAEGLL